ncbi:MAG TPA: phosphotransferase [Candidatus Kapabacteria bacterium]|nr:phosphotransferase [Candidatus Kapabacteria bacterium]
MSRSFLPPDITPTGYDAIRTDTRIWMAAIGEIACRHGLPPDVRPLDGGTNCLAVAGNHHVIKLFPPLLAGQYRSERSALAALAGRLPVETPALQTAGELDGWPYIVMSRLEGVPLEDVWMHIPEAGRLDLMFEIGELIARLQALPAGDLTALEPEWHGFIAAQMERCAARHERLRLPRHLLAGLERYLDRNAPLLPGSFIPTILTGEYTPENLLVQDRNGRWRLTGLIDFGDVMTGFGEYDLIGPGAFLCAGRQARLARLLDGYGIAAAERSEHLRSRLMLMHLLHRYSNFDAQLRLDGWKNRARNLDELAGLVWPFGE